jgi:DNA primase
LQDHRTGGSDGTGGLANGGCEADIPAMALPPGFVEELRTRVSLAQVVGRKVTWESRKSNPAKGDFWAPCPFHQEKSASFHVDEAKGYYYCFGCHAKGDAVTFVRETENLGFMEAVEVLAREAGMAMPARDPAEARRAAANQGLAEAMEAAVRFFRMQLATAPATEARAYLDRRRMSAAIRDRFEIGYAPDEWSALLDLLTGKGFPRERLVEAGLVTSNPGTGNVYDRFRNRIMFPIRDGRGRCIAFGARAIAAGQEPKYLNSPDTPLFDKGRTLYNVGPARSAAGKSGTVVIAEGYMDVIALVEAGVDHSVAPLGTAITETQLELLWKIAPEPVVALDGAGFAAAQRLIDLALPHLGAQRSLRFAIMPAGQDPDDVVKSGGKAAIEAILAASRPIVDLLWRRETEGQVLDSPERRAALDARLRAHLARIADPSLRGHWEREIRARRAALFAPPPRSDRPAGPTSAAGGRGPRGKGPGRRGAPGMAAPTPGTRGSLLATLADGAEAEARIRESAILAGCLHHPDAAHAVEERLEALHFHCRDLGNIRDALLSALSESLHEPHTRDSLGKAMLARLGSDPMPGLMAIGHVRANRHLGPRADSDTAARAIDEEITRHAALAGRTEEVREAVDEIAGNADEALTARLRHAAEAGHEANTRPLAEHTDSDEAEHRNFVSFFAEVEAQQAGRRPRRR